MTYSTSHHAAWEARELDRHLDGGDEYDYDDFTDLPCEWVPALKRWRDVETHLIVSDSEAFDRNNEECARQDEINREIEDMHDREDWE